MIDASFEQPGTLRDGRTVWLRCVRPSDETLLREGFERLSPTSRYARFHTIVKELSAEVVHGLTHVDGVRHFAIAAVERLADGHERGLGVARFVRSPEQPERAEVAVTVVDAAQRLGLASRLLELLGHAARERGIETLVAEVLADNSKARALMHAMGGEPVAREHGLVTYRLDLPLRRVGAVPAAA